MGMTDDELNEVLCRLTALNADQLAGLDRLAGMSDADLDRFTADVDTVWRANQQAIQDAMAEGRQAVQHRAAVEIACANVARARSPQHPVLTADELATVGRAQDAVATAREMLVAAQERFKAGVTEAQLESLRG